MNRELPTTRDGQTEQLDIRTTQLLSSYKRGYASFRDQSFLIHPDEIDTKVGMLPKSALRLAIMASKPEVANELYLVRNIHLLVELGEIERCDDTWGIQITNCAADFPTAPYEPDRLLRAATVNAEREYALTRPHRLAAQWRVLTAAELHSNDYKVSYIGGRFLIMGKGK